MSAEGLPTLGNGYGYLGIAIVAEVLATSFLKSAEGFTRLWPSVIVAVGYGIAFLCLSLTLRTIPTGVAYAIWSARGLCWCRPSPGSSWAKNWMHQL